MESSINDHDDEGNHDNKDNSSKCPKCLSGDMIEHPSFLSIPFLMRGFRRNSSYYSCSSCANCVLCNSWLYYSAAGTSNCWDNNIDYCSGRGSMAVCKIPFTLAENFVLL